MSAIKCKLYGYNCRAKCGKSTSTCSWAHKSFAQYVCMCMFIVYQFSVSSCCALLIWILFLYYFECRLRVLWYFPRLQLLDLSMVSDSERSEARSRGSYLSTVRVPNKLEPDVSIHWLQDVKYIKCIHLTGLFKWLHKGLSFCFMQLAQWCELDWSTSD